MAFYTIRPKSGTKTQWEQANPVLREREIGFEYPDGGLATGLVKMKMGDGTTAWNSLPYAIVGQEEFDITDHLEDSLTSTATDKALTANQGKILKDGIDTALGNVKKFRAGQIILSFNSANAQLFTKYQVDEILGVSDSSGTNVILLVQNADLNTSSSKHLISAYYNESSQRWGVHFDGTVASEAKVNYMLVYFNQEENEVQS